jgi:hypothetical protein
MRRALLCASSDYRDAAFTPLKYPLKDVDEVRGLLEEVDLCDFDEVRVLANPTRAEAHEAIENLTAESGQEDLILFYFSGHGKLARDGSVSLVLNDTKEDRLLSTGLLGDQLRLMFNTSRARQRVIILDCCYAGAVGDEGFKRASGDAVEAMAQQFNGTFVLTASTKFQPAMECKETEGSVFTSCLVEGVRTGAAAERDTGSVTLSRLGEFLAREVPRRSSQQPKFWDFGGVGGTVLARTPWRFDAGWMERTRQSLLRMLGESQIDDALYYEVGKVLESHADRRNEARLQLIDSLVEGRVRPLPFLRKWAEQSEAPEEVKAARATPSPSPSPPPPAPTVADAYRRESPFAVDPPASPSAAVQSASAHAPGAAKPGASQSTSAPNPAAAPAATPKSGGGAVKIIIGIIAVFFILSLLGQCMAAMEGY